MLSLLLSMALAGSLPDVDSPLKTGARNPDDAAVVVGIEDYAFLPDVPHAEQDAQAFEDYLIFTHGIARSRVARVGQANKEKVLRAVREAAEQADDDGTVWIYFAGHGGASPTTGERMLMGIDAQPDIDSFAARSVKVSELRAAATSGGAKAVLVLDTCYTGQGRSGDTLMAGKRFAVPGYAVPAGEQVLEWSAAGPNEFSGPLPGASHGAFTYTVIGALRGWADGVLDDERDGVVTAEEADLYVTQALRALQVRDQRPVLTASNPRDWVLAKHPKGEEAPTLEAPTSVAPAPAPTTSAFEDAGDIAARIREAENLKAEVEAKRAACLQEKANAITTQAAEDWATLASLRDVAEDSADGLAAAREQVNKFITLYAGRQVQCEDSLGTGTLDATAAEVGQARAWLAAMSNQPGQQPSAAPQQPTRDLGPAAWVGPRSGYRMAQIPAGTFTMGAPQGFAGAPLHEVTLTEPFLMGTTEVTQGKWLEVMGRNDALSKECKLPADFGGWEKAGRGDKHGLIGPDRPVMCVTWCDALAFANAMSLRDGLSPTYGGVEDCDNTAGRSVRWDREADGYRLPTEAEWIYAARAGDSVQAVPLHAPEYAGVTSYEAVCQVGNIADHDHAARYTGRPSAGQECSDGASTLASVGGYRPNSWGLYDMTGNVEEWLWDLHGRLSKDPATDPVGATSGKHRGARGGAFDTHPWYATTFYRRRYKPTERSYNLGFRLVRSIH